MCFFKTETLRVHTLKNKYDIRVEKLKCNKIVNLFFKIVNLYFQVWICIYYFLYLVMMKRPGIVLVRSTPLRD